MYVCMYAYIYICIYIYIYIYPCVRTNHVCTCLCTWALCRCECVLADVCHVCMQETGCSYRMYVDLGAVCVCVCVCLWKRVPFLVFSCFDEIMYVCMYRCVYVSLNVYSSCLRDVCDQKSYLNVRDVCDTKTYHITDFKKTCKRDAWKLHVTDLKTIVNAVTLM